MQLQLLTTKNNFTILQPKKATKQVMRNMNRTWWGITNYNTLETLLHAYHMAEIWEKTSENYKMVARLLDPESDICTCMTDVENNDVLNYMNLLAFKIRYPGITSGNKTITDHCESSNHKMLHPLI